MSDTTRAQADRVNSDERSEIARLLVAELQNIATANTRDWDDPTDFKAWAQNRARHTLAKVAALDAALRASQGGRPRYRFRLTVPYWQGRYVETTANCLYTQVRTCLEEYPSQPDHWCGFCRGDSKAEPIASAPSEVVPESSASWVDQSASVMEMARVTTREDELLSALKDAAEFIGSIAGAGSLGQVLVRRGPALAKASTVIAKSVVRATAPEPAMKDGGLLLTPTWNAPCPGCVSEIGRVDPDCPHCHGTGSSSALAGASSTPREGEQ